ncbi:hypothetical protein EVAR_68411_1 [Eumeta japonica]|uniref:Uncharacterized protein n=1 Tax=Eumeta variegata TaxID=151549 RepID=A0A4C1ZYV8_EUMVA|nr:hypothetical protein EVAR_68411_1 [Eumeta japonica]
MIHFTGKRARNPKLDLVAENLTKGASSRRNRENESAGCIKHDRGPRSKPVRIAALRLLVYSQAARLSRTAALHVSARRARKSKLGRARRRRRRRRNFKTQTAADFLYAT